MVCSTKPAAAWPSFHRARAVAVARVHVAPASACPLLLAAALEPAGLLSINLFAEQCGNVTAGGNTIPDHACMAQAAINATKLCGGSVFFPPAVGYQFVRTVFISQAGPSIVGSEHRGDGADQFAVAPQAVISGPADGPAFCVGCGGVVGGFAAAGVSFTDLQINGNGLAVHILHSNCVRFKNVAARALKDMDNVNTTKAGCVGCNVVLNSTNAAIVVENSFWVWFEDCVFHFLPSFDINMQRNPSEAYGQRPSVILRGRHDDPFVGVDTTCKC
jgi:hypothetical protein